MPKSLGMKDDCNVADSVSSSLCEGGSDVGLVDSFGVGDGECVECSLPAEGAGAVASDVADGEIEEAVCSVAGKPGSTPETVRNWASG